MSSEGILNIFWLQYLLNIASYGYTFFDVPSQINGGGRGSIFLIEMLIYFFYLTEIRKVDFITKTTIIILICVIVARRRFLNRFSEQIFLFFLKILNGTMYLLLRSSKSDK